MKVTEFMKGVQPPNPTAPLPPSAGGSAARPDVEAELEERKLAELETRRTEYVPCQSCVVMTRTLPFVMTAYCAWEYRSLPVAHANRRYMAIFGALSVATGIWLNVAYEFEKMTPAQLQSSTASSSNAKRD